MGRTRKSSSIEKQMANGRSGKDSFMVITNHSKTIGSAVYSPRILSVAIRIEFYRRKVLLKLRLSDVEARKVVKN